MLWVRQARDHPEKVGVVLRPATGEVLNRCECIATLSLCSHSADWTITF